MIIRQIKLKALSSAIAICFVSNSNITTKMADDEKPQSRKIFISSVDLFEGKHLAKVNMQYILLIVLYWPKGGYIFWEEINNLMTVARLWRTSTRTYDYKYESNCICFELSLMLL